MVSSSSSALNDNNQKIGSAGIEYGKNGQDIMGIGFGKNNLNSKNSEDTSAITIRQYDDFTSSLSITSVTRSQGGTYTCKVQNDAATVYHSAQLRVNGKIQTKFEQFYLHDINVVFACFSLVLYFL